MSNDIHMRADPLFKKWLDKMKFERAKTNIVNEIESDRKLSKKMMSCKGMRLIEKEMLMTKRGALTDLLVWIIIGFILLVFLATWIVAHGLLTTQLLEAAEENQNSVNFTEAAEVTFGAVDGGLQVFTWATGAIIFAMGLSILISNFLVRVNPVFLVPYFLVVIISIIFSVFLSNAYEVAVAGNALIGETVQSFTGANFIFMNLPIWVTIIGFLGGIMMFIGIVKDRDGGGSFI